MEGFDIHQILRRLPHRYPFLLVDRILQIEIGKSLRAAKNVTMNEPHFQGHFPDFPVMPGVLIIESLAQAAAILAFVSEDKYGENAAVYFAGIDKARFRKPVTPGDQLILSAEVARRKSGLWQMETVATVDGTEVASALLMATLREREA
ncbi:3-hydroxyacyl-ACP dehydratase FabZ [Acidithiobacillus sp. CV18-2]|uniref:3-hydroxyacyl-[acyl-carrier-protein] dehydratase FabZ n=1 Tax=Igneacidithiobacillus copahuensis TaxID=2724909 RepID=A0AAE3CK49_9PROT|nr:3-hydroxyacyl-ACP dehydratase FabZ [Igneacidithiobacillus copahuensis]MBU2753505.1 3-hydroxyacyl-ACP dehydratase FabZ [Acidithiobacillus sp. CV18-3]MBU2757123.1 3-hydroxyacyl-ACP dehydratase FabZ [Acidithiobacillus sp. BN09-2]MBU2775999.1 3-hydroxyacyl-ACP dehydratase FabZ [Acidithiobacillus sp. CV18-2]MBU2795890.1 3-hydroxyacyl-ACP dehydratase FabZ [Acidithiobacillus sp. VAN18-2]MBU2800324.1 3-hydroxyacyl-ACP dehydratase FabZ [Acidithiobacillus sp. VAN18-4]MDD3761361.1 3-hydroxyacyl-ACP d